MRYLRTVIFAMALCTAAAAFVSVAGSALGRRLPNVAGGPVQGALCATGPGAATALPQPEGRGPVVVPLVRTVGRSRGFGPAALLGPRGQAFFALLHGRYVDAVTSAPPLSPAEQYRLSVDCICPACLELQYRCAELVEPFGSTYWAPHTQVEIDAYNGAIDCKLGYNACFQRWQGSNGGGYTGTSPTATVTMNAITVSDVAYFVCKDACE